MSGKTGAAWCLERGLHTWRPQGDVDVCAECGDTRPAEPTLFTADEVDALDALDANREVSR